MRQFIDITVDDLWTALRGGRIIQDQHKPKPYKNFRELTFDEKVLVQCLNNTSILYSGFPDSKKLIWTTMANFICEDYPSLAAKHGLVLNRDHEYWRRK